LSLGKNGGVVSSEGVWNQRFDCSCVDGGRSDVFAKGVVEAKLVVFELLGNAVNLGFALVDE